MKKESVLDLIVTVFFSVFFIGFLLFIMKSMSEGGFPIMFYIVPLLMIGIFIYAFISTVFGGKKNRDYKENVVRPLLATILPDMMYYPEMGFERERILATNLFAKGNRYNSTDFVSATYKGYRFELSNVFIEDVTTDGEGHTSTTTYFNGPWLIVRPDKETQSNLYVLNRKNRFSRPKGWLFGDRSLNVVSMESEVFNRAYSVLAEEEHDAFYVLTPQIQEKLMGLVDARVSMLQSINEIHLALNTNKPLFNTGLFSDASFDASQDKITQELNSMMSLIDLIVKQTYTHDKA